MKRCTDNTQQPMPQQRHHDPERGQALVEYVLILALFIVGFAVAIAATGPVIGNVFSNTVYNLVGADPEVASLDATENPFADVEQFWETVTIVASLTPPEEPLPPRTQPPSTATFTPGPPPTATPIVPTDTPTPSKTPVPPPPEPDLRLSYPFTDSGVPGADETWRLQNDFALNAELGYFDWYGVYYPDAELSGDSVGEGYNEDVFGENYGQLDFNFTGGAIFDQPADNFGVQWRRVINVGTDSSDETTLQFRVNNANDGFRIWILGGIYGGTPSLTNGDDSNCSNQLVPGESRIVTSGGPAYSSGAGRTFGDQDPHVGYAPVANPTADTASTECLLADYWIAGSRSNIVIERTIPNGNYVIQVDYFDQTGSAVFDMDITNPDLLVNPDDALVDNSGVEQTGTPFCAWSRNNTASDAFDRRANSLPNTWDEFLPGERFPEGQRCHLELRGFIPVPDTATNPTLTFYDAWDLRTGSLAYLEVAEYAEDDSVPGGPFADRAELNWQRIDMHNGDTYNYNWTKHTIPLDGIISSYTPTDGSERLLTFRFVIENRQSTEQNKWYIDTMRVGDVEEPEPIYTNQSWDFNSADQLDDFIMTGQWGLTSGAGEARGAGSALHDSPGSLDTARFPEARNPSNFTPPVDEALRDDMRVHAFEFNGAIDLAGSPTEDENNVTGEQIMTFWHRYDVGNRTSLQLQFTTAPYACVDEMFDTSTAYPCGDDVPPSVSPTADNPVPTWTTVPSVGEFVSYDASNGASIGEFQFVTVPFALIEDAIIAASPTDTLVPFRLRFAMTIHANSSSGDGWWIDDIFLGRQSGSTYLQYPFYDDANRESNLATDWLNSGSWGLTPINGGRRDPNVGAEGTGYMDSPAFPYGANQTSSLQLARPLDLYWDSPDNPYSPECTLVDDCETATQGPLNPVLSFYHRRLLDNAGEEFAVQWKRAFVETDEWETLWAYRDQLATNSINYSQTRRQLAWEHVLVDLAPIRRFIAANNTADATDDDILLRFVFRSDGSGGDEVASGVYLDDIRLYERPQTYWRLWEDGAIGAVNVTENNIDAATAIAIYGDQASIPTEYLVGDDAGEPGGVNYFSAGLLGQGDFFDGIDNNPRIYSTQNPAYFYGGDWNRILWERRTGIASLHDSPYGFQTSAPPDIAVNDSTHATDVDAFSVLEMGTIFDLRAATATDQPILEFWSRYAIGEKAKAQVQVSYFDPTLVNARNDSDCAMTEDAPAGENSINVLQCYERGYGWSEWTNAGAMTEFDLDDDDRTYQWERFRVPLDAYARRSGVDGRLIRIRWIVDTYETPSGDSWDGVYIDNISVKFNDPRVVPITPTGSIFTDSGRNMNNWIGEGTWGLSPEFFRGSGGGPQDLSANNWSFAFWDRSSVVMSDFRGVAAAETFTVDNYGTPDPGGFETFSDPFGYLAYFDYFLTQPGGGPIATAADGNTFDTGNVSEISYDWGTGGPNDGTTTLSDSFVGRWVLDTGRVVEDLGTEAGDLESGNYTFIVTSDDGVRFRYQSLNAAGTATTNDVNPQGDWNIVNNWTYHGRTVDMGTADLKAESEGGHVGARYRFTLEYFEDTDDAVLELSTGSDTFSFTDSPKGGPGLVFEEVGALERSHSSLVFDGVFDLTNADEPYLQYYTYWETRNKTYLNVEVSEDGGLTWDQLGLNGKDGPEGALFNQSWETPWIAAYFRGRFLDDQVDIEANDNPNNLTTSTVPDVIETIGPEVNTKENGWPGPPGGIWRKDRFADPVGEGRGIGNSNPEYFSVRFYRKINLALPTSVKFKMQSDDGSRLWIFSEADDSRPIIDPGGASYSLDIDGETVDLPVMNVAGGLPCAQDDSSGDKFISGQAGNPGMEAGPYEEGDADGGCVALSMWRPQSYGSKTAEVRRDLPAGETWLVMDFYEQTGGDDVSLEISGARSIGFDDPEFGGASGPDVRMPSNVSDINEDWRFRRHDLRRYAGQSNIGLRFEYNSVGERGPSEPGYNCPDNSYNPNPFPACNYQRNDQSPVDWKESWWIVDLAILDEDVAPETPQQRLNRAWTTDYWTTASWNVTDLGAPVSNGGSGVAPHFTGDTDWGDTIDANGNSGWPPSSHVEEFDGNDFSMTFERTLELTEPLTVEFNIRSDDGFRLWRNYGPGCATDSAGQPIIPGLPSADTDAIYNVGDECLIFDDWENQGMASNPTKILYTLSAGTHDLRIDYYQGTGGKGIEFDVKIP